MKILILSNNLSGLYKFRFGLIKRVLGEGKFVWISAPRDDYFYEFQKMGCNVIDSPIDRRGTNPFFDLQLFLYYVRIINKINPDIVLTYTIKPNIYGGMACSLAKIPYLVNITGFGNYMEGSILNNVVIFPLLKICLKKADVVFFQNKQNFDFFIKNRLIRSCMNSKLIPGSGVDIDQYSYNAYPPDSNIIRFLFVGRIMKAKGVEELLYVIERVKKNFPDASFEIVGPYEELKLKDTFQKSIYSNALIYHGTQKSLSPFYQKCHAVIHPSHHEGMCNVLLEAASTGRPVLASNIPGCRETFEEGVSGFGFAPKNVDNMLSVIEKFIRLPYQEKKAMGIAGRKKMEREFDRNIVVNAYMKEIEKSINKKKEK